MKWFEDPAQYPVRLDLVLSSRTALLLIVAASAVAAFCVLERLAGDPHWPRPEFLRRMAVGAPTLLAIQSAITLAYAAAQPSLLAPNMRPPEDPLGLIIGALEAIIAFAFFTGIGDWVAGLILVLLGPLGFLLFPPFDVIDQLHWVGIAQVIVVIGRHAADSARRGPGPHGQWPACG